MGPNSREALVRRRDARTLTWRGPALVLFARTVFAVGAQGVVAVIFALRGSPTPWRDSEPWLPVYGTLIDLGCLALLWHLTRKEGIRLFDLAGFARSRLGRDVLIGLGLIPVALLLIYAGSYAAGWVVYGAFEPPVFLGGLPLPATLYGVLIWPLIWGLTEQTTYNGYLVPRFQVLGSTSVALVVVTIVWSLQHSFMPLTFDAEFMTYRALAPIPFSVFQAWLYLRLRRVIPFALAHAILDSSTVVIPLLRA